MTPRSLVEELLADQQGLTAVEQFSRIHEENLLPEHEPFYRDLIPLEAPRPGEQYAFEVELNKCSGCKACVTACHSLNGLDDNETWRDVGLLVSAPAKPWKKIPAVQQAVTTACHHCVEPGCLEGCPVLAYEKDPLTGIVRHLDDQCIGCQYCVLKCPYDVPKYNSRLGIVRKCDMCSSRLAVGEAPACVQACPNEAIRITKVSKNEVTIQFRQRKESFLVGAPEGDYTLPTTRYINTAASGGAAVEAPMSAAPAKSLIPADQAELKAQPAHWPLVVMLVLTQASVGVLARAATQDSPSLFFLWLSFAFALFGLTASAFHLGRPLGAWRSFLNLRRSWMSREIVIFGLFITLLTAACAWVALLGPESSTVMRRLAGLAAISGAAGVFCSMMIYHDTRRPLWHGRRSALMFFGTTALFGAAAWFAANPANPAAAAFLGIIVAAKLLVEASIARHAAGRALTPLKKSALLITGRYQPVAFAHVAFLVTGGIGLPLLMGTGLEIGPFQALGPMLVFVLLLAGELMERFLFFTTVVAPKMPGGLVA